MMADRSDLTVKFRICVCVRVVGMGRSITNEEQKQDGNVIPIIVIDRNCIICEGKGYTASISPTDDFIRRANRKEG